MIKLVSFSFKHGAPPAADAVIDCRILRNPHHVADLRRLDGRAKQVREYVSRDPAFERLMHRVRTAARIRAGVIACGCYGGRHRSVAVAEIAAEWLRAHGHQVVIEHTALTPLLDPT